MLRFLLSGDSIKSRIAKQYTGPEILLDHCYQRLSTMPTKIFGKSALDTRRQVKEHLCENGISEEMVDELLVLYE